MKRHSNTCNCSLYLCIKYALDAGAGAVEFILCHAEVEIAFTEEKKIEQV